MLLLILILGGAYFLVGALSRASNKIENDKQTSDALAKAKATLIGWAVSRNDPLVPGMFPYPDRRNDGNYDGLSDCPSNANQVPTSPSLLLGKLPRIGTEAPCVEGVTPLALDVVDGAGEVPWYAVSRNLVASSTSGPILNSLPMINPDIRNNPPYPWLVVRGATGNVISDRVAAVIIAPGPPLGLLNQLRTPPNPTPSQFLESIAGVASNADFDGNYDNLAPCTPTTAVSMCEDFVIAEPSETFNDQLIYITIDELMPLLELRAARTARAALNTSFTNSAGTQATRFFPYPADLGYQTSSCNTGITSGSLPIPICNCTDDRNCDCPLDGGIATVSFTFAATGTYTSTQNCTSPPASKTCNCTGAGSCTSTAPSRTFTCTFAGACSSNVSGTFTYDYPDLGTFGDLTLPPPISTSCTWTSGNKSFACTPSGAGNRAGWRDVVGCTTFSTSPPLSLNQILPAWFLNNGWRHYVYYALSNECTQATSGCDGPGPFLTVGTTPNVNAIVISTGVALTGQSRPSSVVTDFLEAGNNDADSSFVGEGAPLTNNFNDQSVIVSP